MHFVYFLTYNRKAASYVPPFPKYIRFSLPDVECKRIPLTGKLYGFRRNSAEYHSRQSTPILYPMRVGRTGLDMAITNRDQAEGTEQ